jgi:hypothetical protein
LIYVQSNGSYALDEHKQLVCASIPTICLSRRQLAQTLSLAQDCFLAAQSCYALSGDLVIYILLAETTVKALELLMDLGELTIEPFAWGILGLIAGYKSSDSRFDTYKQQLYVAIDSLPTPSCELNPAESAHRMVQAEMGRITQQSVAHRQMHRSAMKDWTQLRWFYGVQVVRRWIEHLETVESKEDLKNRAKEDEPTSLLHHGSDDWVSTSMEAFGPVRPRDSGCAKKSGSIDV